MTHDKNLLVELFVEELPPKALKKLGDAFAGVLPDSLQGAGPGRRPTSVAHAVRLAAPAGRARHGASPRRRPTRRCRKSSCR